MKDDIDFCKFFSDIEKNPYAKVPPITIGQFIKAREHAYSCATCMDRINRVAAQADLKDDINLSNQN